MTTNPKQYIGRFAPSPSGPLHFGSLVCALASYLDARKNNGKWLVRIEDIDPPREQAGAAESILNTLTKHGLIWDEAVTYQSSNSKRYETILTSLFQNNVSYRCNCTRKRLKGLVGSYDQHCLYHTPKENEATAVRLNINTALRKLNSGASIEFEDRIQGRTRQDIAKSGDFIIHRKDKLFAYQLAVAVDDTEQNITHVVRGIDLLETTPQQILIMHLLRKTIPQYAHIPVVINGRGEKLSKQNHAPALNTLRAKDNLHSACLALNMHPPADLAQHTLDRIISWAVENWDLTRLKNTAHIANPLE